MQMIQKITQYTKRLCLVATLLIPAYALVNSGIELESAEAQKLVKKTKTTKTKKSLKPVKRKKATRTKVTPTKRKSSVQPR